MSPCQTYIKSLRTAGYRITPQREMIIEAISHSGDHINAEQVLAHIRKKSSSVNIATVYRTLEMLVEEGLANRIDLGEGRIIYATTSHGSHIHLVCKQCGQVIDAEPNLLNGLNDQFKTMYQFSADLQHISVPGLCNECNSS